MHRSLAAGAGQRRRSAGPAPGSAQRRRAAQGRRRRLPPRARARRHRAGGHPGRQPARGPASPGARGDGRTDGLDASSARTTWRRTTTSATSTWRAAKCRKPSTEFETATRLQPDALPPYVNVALAYNALGQNDKAEASLRHALSLDPTNAAANLNLGMLLAEMGKMSEAEQAFRAAFKADPRSAQAAYNLGILLSKDQPEEALTWCSPGRRASTREPAVRLHLRLLPLSRGPARRSPEGHSPGAPACSGARGQHELRAPTPARAGAQAQRGQAVIHQGPGVPRGGGDPGACFPLIHRKTCSAEAREAVPSTLWSA